MGSFRPAAGNPCLHGSHTFAESLVETALSSLRHSCRSELHAFPVARGVDYTFISTRGYFFLPVELISAAIVAIRLNPLSVKCSPRLIISQIAARCSKSRCLADSIGYCRKCGTTFASNSGTLRTSYLSVLSEWSGRIVPHPNVSRNNPRISARSRFWLTEKLGRTSQPKACRALRLNVTQKHPSPSA